MLCCDPQGHGGSRDVTRNNEQFWSACSGKDLSYAGMRPIGGSIRLELFTKSLWYKIVPWPDRVRFPNKMVQPPCERAHHKDMLSKQPFTAEGAEVLIERLNHSALCFFRVHILSVLCASAVQYLSAVDGHYTRQGLNSSFLIRPTLPRMGGGTRSVASTAQSVGQLHGQDFQP
jgi:hypothetical protein